ncbi:hypothetical protein TPA0907_44110 [Micromonospora humidisoli]|uniref:Uncharacterized protein n=1 Tax=Micromonospora humidisoli TaxID=2807622 RepID=A0ABS2J3K7_9ACTN|nr:MULTISPECIES: hypothetical protein [Micromonospora]MBM7081147.1 hypothetical protein [Micromonospora humidisoli]GHJ10044.1 hypothetical protein TPA0907_44110 [Micromonospora sp. AKA109]
MAATGVGMDLPAYYSYYDSPVKVVATEDGVPQVWRIVMDTGGWMRDDSILGELLFAAAGEVSRRSAEEFVQDVERYRSDYLSGDGPVFALYETAAAIIDSAVRERRNPSPRERAMVRGIRRKTFVMFEEALRAAGDPAADPNVEG